MSTAGDVVVSDYLMGMMKIAESTVMAFICLMSDLRGIV